MRLAHADTGSPPVVVLLHGFPLSREMWAEQLKALGRNLSGDRAGPPGHGESACPDGVYTMEAMADDVVELLDRPGRQPTGRLGGLSMGGYVALALVLAPSRAGPGLMLIDTRAAADTPEAAEGARGDGASRCSRRGPTQSIARDDGPQALRQDHLGEAAPARRADAGGHGADLAPGSGRGPARHGGPARPARRPGARSRAHAGDGRPGRCDLAPSRRPARSPRPLPHARLEVIPAAGHLAPYENPPAANEVDPPVPEGAGSRPRARGAGVTACQPESDRSGPEA